MTYLHYTTAGDASAGAMMLATAGFALQEKRQQKQQTQGAVGANTKMKVVASAVQQQIGWR
jgi:hypothetical protein